MLGMKIFTIAVQPPFFASTRWLDSDLPLCVCKLIDLASKLRRRSDGGSADATLHLTRLRKPPVVVLGAKVDRTQRDRETNTIYDARNYG